MDTSSIEIFCNDGERVLTSRIFPNEDATGIKASTESGQVYLKFTKYELRVIYNETSICYWRH